MHPETFERAARCLEKIAIAYAATGSEADFQSGAVKLNGQSIGRFPNAAAWAKSLGGRLIHETSAGEQQTYVWGYASRDDARRCIEIAFRGTLRLRDWQVNFGDLRARNVAADLTHWPIPNGPEMLVRSSWLKPYAGLRDAALETLEALLQGAPSGEPYALEISGHSLGAAIATLLAADLVSHLANTRRPISLTTFGSPRVGSDQLLNHLNAGAVTVDRIFVSGDLVPHVPSKGILGRGAEAKTFYLDHVGAPTPLFTGAIQQTAQGAIYSPADEDSFFIRVHQLESYSNALRATHHTRGVYRSIDPSWSFSSVLLSIRTGDSLLAGTNSDVYVEVLGHRMLLDYPWYDDFEPGREDMYLIALAEPLTIEAFQRHPLRFRVSGSDGWQPRSVAVRVGNGEFERTNSFGRMEYAWSGDWQLLANVSFGEQEVTQDQEAVRSAWPVELQEQLQLPSGELRLQTLSTQPSIGREPYFLTVDFAESEGTGVVVHPAVGEVPYQYQRWRLRFSASEVPSYYIETAANPDMVLDAAGSRLGDSSNLIQWKRKSPLAANQLWIFRPVGPGQFIITSALNPEYALDVQGDNTLKVRRITGAKPQIFQLLGLPGTVQSV